MVEEGSEGDDGDGRGSKRVREEVREWGRDAGKESSVGRRE